MEHKYPDTITYWSRGALNEYADLTYNTPVQIKGRWQDTTERNINTSQEPGKQEISNAVIYTETEIEPDGYVYLGTSIESSPKGVAGIYRVLKVNRVSTLRGDKTLYKAML